MSAAADDYQELLSRARGGDPRAMGQLARVYEPEVRLVARARLGAALRPLLDSLDLVQSVHRCVLLGLRGGRFDVSTPDKLVAVATGMVRNKVARHWRDLRRQQRASADVGDRSRLTHLLGALTSRERDPARVAELQDQISQLQNELDDRESRIIQLRLQGCSTAEAAGTLGLDPDVLRVQLGRLRKRLRSNGLALEWL